MHVIMEFIKSYDVRWFNIYYIINEFYIEFIIYFALKSNYFIVIRLVIYTKCVSIYIRTYKAKFDFNVCKLRIIITYYIALPTKKFHK